MSLPQWIASLTAGLALATVSCPVEGRDAERPNVLFILADDMGRECLGCYGGQSYPTPTLDRLASCGVRFDTCYATPLCSPTRVELLTGRYSFRNYTLWRYLDPSEITFAQLLKQAGYATALAGKWQLEGWDRRPQGIFQAGFDEYLSYEEMAVLPDRDNNVYWGGAIWRNGKHLKPDRYTPELYTDFLIDFMRRNRDRPFLAYYTMNLLHRPFVPTADHPGSPSLGSPPPVDWQRDAANFPEMVAYVDKMVAKLLAALEELDLSANTVVVFTADNGTDNVAEAKQVESIWHGQKVRGGKYFPTEWGVNVPLIVRWPGRIEGNRILDDLVDFTDILPTLCDLAEAPLPDDRRLDGRSFKPQLLGKRGTPRDYVYSWGNFENNSSKYKDPAAHTDELIDVIRGRQWKLYSDDRLFDLSADPFEKHPVAPGTSDQADAAKRRLTSQLRSLRSSAPRLW